MNPGQGYPSFDVGVENLLARMSLTSPPPQASAASTIGSSSGSETLYSAQSGFRTAASSVGRAGPSLPPPPTSARPAIMMQEESELSAGTEFDWRAPAPYNSVASQVGLPAASAKVMAVKEPPAAPAKVVVVEEPIAASAIMVGEPLAASAKAMVVEEPLQGPAGGHVDGSGERVIAHESGSADRIHKLISRLQEMEHENYALFTRNARLTAQMREKDQIIAQLMSERQCMHLAAQNQVGVLKKFQECMDEFQDLVFDISEENLTMIENGLSVVETLGSKFIWRNYHQVHVYRPFQGSDLTIGESVFHQSVCQKLQAVVGTDQVSEGSQCASLPLKIAPEEVSFDSLLEFPVPEFRSGPVARIGKRAGTDSGKSSDASEHSFDPDRAESSQALSTTSSGSGQSLCPDNYDEKEYDLQPSPSPCDELLQLLKQKYDSGSLGNFGRFAATDNILNALVPDIVQDIVAQFRSLNEKILKNSSVVLPSNEQIISWVNQIDMNPPAFSQAAFEKNKDHCFLDWSGVIPPGSPEDIAEVFFGTFVCPKVDFRSFWFLMTTHYLTWNTYTSRVVAGYIREL